MGLRTPKVQLAYDEFTQHYSGICPFCDVTERAPEVIIETYGNLRVTQNEYPYHEWDANPVVDHLMIVPVRHILALHELSTSETTNYVQLLKRYEKNGYSIYSRSPRNHMRTVGHLHTHLIKLADQ